MKLKLEGWLEQVHRTSHEVTGSHQENSDRNCSNIILFS